MKHRAIKDLNQLNDAKLFYEISIGLGKIYENCIELNTSSKYLNENKKYRASRIIEAVAKEEAAKYLILIDVLRCPRKNHKQMTRQLAKFNDHMAKGIYSELCGWRASSYSELCQYIETELNEFFLDGPTGGEWIFRNSIISKREEAFYVDYVQYEEGEHEWQTPRLNDKISELLASPSNSSVIKMVKAINSIGISKVNSIQIFANFWREFKFDANTHYQDFKKANLRCLEDLERNNLLNEASEAEYSLVVNEMPFPLYKEEMKEKKIPVVTLKERQKKRHP
jgi:AbiV family abortive infection protein